jgi:cytochrome c oxidase subunit 5b
VTSACSPSDLDQATGIERMELLSKLEGKDPFFMEPLEMTRLGTPKDPIVVASLASLSCGTLTSRSSCIQDDYRIVGCSGFPADS